MSAWASQHEAAIRLGFFLGVFAVMALWEVMAPRRPLTQSKLRRWLNNLGLVALNTLVLRLIFPAAAVGMAVVAGERGWGLFNNLETPAWAAGILAFLILDLAIYLQHVMFHAVPALWRLHRVHHADLDFDVTTGARFHPVEILLSMVLKLALVAVIGPPVLAVLLFEVVLNATAMFNHANARLPPGLDRVLRRFLVTPDMHRVHHSIVAGETNSNFGFNLPWWDRLLGTYRAQPAAGHGGMTIGLDHVREPRRCVDLAGLLALPFLPELGAYAINRRWNASDHTDDSGPGPRERER
ncbi:MAG: sterol desaturase family protein [Gammaproteobacteria bacterium]|nr:sterol desaturase family protein [Gammaproteobacteria bacterium]